MRLTLLTTAAVLALGLRRIRQCRSFRREA